MVTKTGRKKEIVQLQLKSQSYGCKVSNKYNLFFNYSKQGKSNSYITYVCQYAVTWWWGGEGLGFITAPPHRLTPFGPMTKLP